MSDDIGHWSSYSSDPESSLDIFDRARKRCPVALSDEHEGFYLLLNHRDVKNAMMDHKTFSSEPQVLRPMLPRKPIPALEMDPPRHQSWRAIFDGAMSAKTTQALEPFVRADINRHIDSFVTKGYCDIVTALTQPVPAETICRLVGIDEQLVPQVRETALAMFAAQGDPIEFGRRQAAFAKIAVTEVHRRRARPCNDYLTQLAGVLVEGLPLDDDDYVVLLAAFLGAGHHSTTSAMTTLIYDVYSDADVLGALLKDRGKIPAAVEESLRLRPPFYGFFRRTTKSTRVAGTDIYAGTDVYLSWAAANRDPKCFADPLKFRIDRLQNEHVSFGVGVHACPGADLARMELRVLLEELLLRLPDMHVDPEPPPYQFGGGDYAFMPSLKVTFPAGKPFPR
jgi:cytochrome P450